MKVFELHVCQHEKWRRLEIFEDRDAAMSASIKLECDQRYSGIKVIKETYDEEHKPFKTKLIHKWSEDLEKKAKDKEIEQNLERQRLERNKLRQQAQTQNESWQADVRGYLIFTATVITFVAGTIIVVMLGLRGL